MWRYTGLEKGQDKQAGRAGEVGDSNTPRKTVRVYGKMGTDTEEYRVGHKKRGIVATMNDHGMRKTASWAVAEGKDGRFGGIQDGRRMGDGARIYSRGEGWGREGGRGRLFPRKARIMANRRHSRFSDEPMIAFSAPHVRRRGAI